MIEQTALIIDAGSKEHYIEKINDESIIGPIDYGFREFEKGKDNFIAFGKGILSGSNIPGTKRMMFTAYSPLWNHFYISTMGGAAYVFHHLGINYVKITGECGNYSVLALNRKNGHVTVDFYDIDAEEVWSGYKGEVGLYALQHYVLDNYGQNFTTCRILATGPASLKTKMGAISSAPIVNSQITPVDCWAGRGGMGSKLLQDHRIAAIIYGGNFEEPADSPIRDVHEINRLFEEKFHKKMIVEDMEATMKYRYDHTFHSGGTLGVNFTKLKSWMFCFNYQSVNFSDEDRKEIHEKFIVEHYLRQFNEETIDKKQFKHCGEPCGAVCKKMNGIYKKDYEPYEALGPNIGVFDQRAAEKINHFVDAMGFDAIQAGSLVSWIMECVLKNKFPKEDFGFDLEPKWDFKNFDVVHGSLHNANVAYKIIKAVLNDEKCAVFRMGIRNAAKEIDKKYKTDSINLAVFNAFGDEGCIVPNQYWVPGMFSPMPIMGKYFEYYGADYLHPYELGKKNVERMIKELYNDNTGICRFHRKWVEELIETIVDDLFNVQIDYFSHHKKLAQLINWGNKPVFWESERVVDIIFRYLEKVLSGEPENQELKELVDKFKADKWGAAKEYWESLRDGMYKGFE